MLPSGVAPPPEKAMRAMIDAAREANLLHYWENRR